MGNDQRLGGLGVQAIQSAQTIVFALCCLWALAAPAEEAANDWAYLDNGIVRVGVKKSSGAGVAWFGASGTRRNLVDHFDRGRLIQQSYYGEQDGSLWVDKPWSWNPVQGGDYRGGGAKLLELRIDQNTLYAKTEPKHWASGAALPEVTMEEWITLAGSVAHIRFRATYTGATKHPPRAQELPAVFVDSQLKTLVLYDGDQPWMEQPLSRSVPGWPNESRKITENWAAYLDDSGFGLGAYVPVATELTCYRFGETGQPSACSYFAPLKTFAFTPGLVWEYDLFLTLGDVDQMRSTFAKLHAQGGKLRFANPE